MFICNISDSQKKATGKVLKHILKKYPFDGTESVLRKLYDISYESFANQGQVDKAQEYSIAITQYGAMVFSRLLQVEDDKIRSIFSQFVTEEQLTPESVLRYTEIDKIKTMIGISYDIAKKPIYPIIEREAMSSFLDKIKTSFSDPLTKQKYSVRGPVSGEFELSTIKEGDKIIPLRRITEFANNKTYPEKSYGNESMFIGNMSDRAFRLFVNNKDLSYTELIKLIVNDPVVNNEYKALLEKVSMRVDTNTYQFDYFDEEQRKSYDIYLNDFIKTLTYSFSKFSEEYKDYYVTDLSELGSDFAIYSPKLGLRGTIDFIAISPTGTFRIIDIKTRSISRNYVEQVEKGKEADQINAYALIIEQMTGLKNEGNDIFKIEYQRRHPAADVVDVFKPNIFLSAVKTNVEKHASFDRKKLIEKINKFKSSSEKIFSTPVKIASSDTDIKLDLPSIDQILFNKLRDGGLKQIFLRSEELETKDGLQRGIKWMNEVMPELGESSVRIATNILSSAGGEFFKDVILLYERSNKGVAYHEGWHRFSQLYLTDVERDSLYNRIRKANITFVNRKGEQHNSSSAPLEEIEEYLAEQFKDFVVATQEGRKYSFPKDTGGKTKNIFQRILDILKKFFGFYNQYGDLAFTEIFSNLYTGSFNRSNFSKDNGVFHHLNSLFLDHTAGKGEVMDSNTFAKWVRFSDNLVSNMLLAGNKGEAGITSTSILDYLNKDGIIRIKQDLFDNYKKYSNQLSDISDNISSAMAALPNNSENYKAYGERLTYIQSINSEISSILENFDNFVLSYFASTQYSSLKLFNRSNLKNIRKIVEADTLLQEETLDDEQPVMTSDEAGGNKPVEEDEDILDIIDSLPDIEYNRSGNEKQALDVAKSALKDWFIGIPRLNNYSGSDTSLDLSDELTTDDLSVPLSLPVREAFYKTLEILNGSMDVEEIRKRLSIESNFLKFPELIFIKTKLFGGYNPILKRTIKGVIPELEELNRLMDQGSPSIAVEEEYRNKSQFLMQFIHVIGSITKIDYKSIILTSETTAVNENFYFEEEVANPKRSPVIMRDNTEAITSSILNDFGLNFQKNAIEDSVNYKSLPALIDAFSAFLSNDVASIPNRLGNPSAKYIYDETRNRYHFNPFYLAKKANDSSIPFYAQSAVGTTSVNELKAFYDYLGVNINQSAYENEADLQVLIDNFYRLREVLQSYKNDVEDYALSLRNNKFVMDKFLDFVSLHVKKNRSIVENIQYQQSIDALRSNMGYIFSISPVSDFLFDSRDSKLIYNKDRRISAINYPIFLELAKVQKKYHANFSSGSVYVGRNKNLEFTYHLPSQMTVISNLMKNKISSIGDFNNVQALSHLNPAINPQVMNSVTYKYMFDEQGNRTKYSPKVEKLSQIDLRSMGNEEVKKISELTDDEKLMTDVISYLFNGWSEIRRMEASNSSFMYSIQDENGNYVKPINYGIINGKVTDWTNNQSFQSHVRGYIQWAAWKYAYYLKNPSKKVGQPHADKLSVFDEMLPKNIGEIKEFIKTQIDKNPNYNLNTLFSDIFLMNEKLYDDINEEIVEYFENVAFNGVMGEPSYASMLETILSDKSKNILKNIAEQAEKSNDPIYFNTTQSGKVIADHAIREIIANDFIAVMEDSIFFFGDYTLYKDPIKRRKVVGNNGSVNYISPELSSLLRNLDKNSLGSVYKKNKGITRVKDITRTSKYVVKDMEVESSYLRNVGSEIYILKNILDVEDLTKNFTPEQRKARYAELLEEKKAVIDALGNMEIADAAAYINLDFYRKMRLREQLWSSNDQREYERQVLILRKTLGEDLTEDEQAEIDGGSYSVFNIAKFATTGPVLNQTDHVGSLMSFDKMALIPLLPSEHLDRETGRIMFDMLENDVDYVMFSTGMKGYKSDAYDAFSQGNYKFSLDTDVVEKTEFDGAFTKMQLNLFTKHDDSALSVQLRSLFPNIILEFEKQGKNTNSLRKDYNFFIETLSKLMQFQSNKTLDELGLNRDGTMKDTAKFVSYIRKRLEEKGDIDQRLLSKLNINRDTTFSSLFESLPIQSNIIDLVAGIVDDGFRDLRLYGSKLIQSPELGTTLSRLDLSNIPADLRGTVQLKWHDLKRVNGKVVSTLPVEAKIPFRSQFLPLLELLPKKGKTLEESIRYLNNALQDPKFVEDNYDSLTMIGVRIPLQDQSFVSHVIIKEFLSPTLGDTIVLPPEFYKQTGSDNDADTVTVTFKYLDPSTGKQVKVDTHSSYDAIIEQLLEVNEDLEKLSQSSTPSVDLNSQFKGKIQKLKDLAISMGVYHKYGLPTSELNNDLTIVEDEDGIVNFEGLLDKKSIFNKGKLIKKGEYNEFVDAMFELLEEVKNFRGPSVGEISKQKELLLETRNQLLKVKNNYKKSLQNDLVEIMQKFLELPENYSYLVDTDSIEPLKQIAEKVQSTIQNKKVELGKEMTALRSTLPSINLTAHKNNFQVRTMLGALVKFGRLDRVLSIVDTYINRSYIAGSLAYLGQENFLSLAGKTYPRLIRLPLSYKSGDNPAVTTDSIHLSVYDENGDRMTKNVSMLVSSLLDLFKNLDIFPSLNVSWNNLKLLIFHMATGVPMERSLLFLNSPVVLETEAMIKKMGTDAQYRHALAATAEELFPGELVLDSPYNEFGQINTYMGRPAKGAENYLSSIKEKLYFTEEDMEEFSKDFAKFKTTNKNKLRAFLYPSKSDSDFEKRTQYKLLAKNLLAYYITSIEDADYFYKFAIKPLDRDSAKYSSLSKNASAQVIERQVRNSKFMENGFFDKIKMHTVFKPFYYNTEITEILKNTMPSLLNRPGFEIVGNKIVSLITQLTSSVYETDDQKRAMEVDILGNIVDAIVKNFYVLKDARGNVNFISDYFVIDKQPQLGQLTVASELISKRKRIGDYQEIRSVYNIIKDWQGREAELYAGQENFTRLVEAIYQESTFTRQIDLIRSKYPLLNELLIVNKLAVKKAAPSKFNKAEEIREDKIGRNPSKVMSEMMQVYMELNVSGNALERHDEEITMRSEWEKLVNFDINNFSNLRALAGLNNELDLYTDPENVKEIQTYFTLLAHYALSQTGHIPRSRGSFSHLIPQFMLQEIVDKAFNNFFSSLGDLSSKQNNIVDLIFNNIRTAYISMNFSRYKWESSITKGVSNYKKGYAGTLYGEYFDQIEVLRKIKESIKSNDMASEVPLSMVPSLAITEVKRNELDKNDHKWFRDGKNFSFSYMLNGQRTNRVYDSEGNFLYETKVNTNGRNSFFVKFDTGEDNPLIC